jgi:folate-dependent tRNA-U54 methylase TrmFO/GidA
MSKLTAMQELIESLKNGIETINDTSVNSVAWRTGYRDALYNVINAIEMNFMPIEMKRIIDAVNSTFDNTTFQKDGDGYMNCPFDGEQYYTQTFTQK